MVNSRHFYFKVNFGKQIQTGVGCPKFIFMLCSPLSAFAQQTLSAYCVSSVRCRDGCHSVSTHERTEVSGGKRPVKNEPTTRQTVGIMRERNSKGYRNAIHREEQLISAGMFRKVQGECDI